MKTEEEIRERLAKIDADLKNEPVLEYRIALTVQSAMLEWVLGE